MSSSLTSVTVYRTLRSAWWTDLPFPRERPVGTASCLGGFLVLGDCSGFGCIFAGWYASVVGTVLSVRRGRLGQLLVYIDIFLILGSFLVWHSFYVLLEPFEVVDWGDSVPDSSSSRVSAHSSVSALEFSSLLLTSR